MAKKNDTDKLSELLSSFNGDLLGDDLPQQFSDDSIKVERILLDLVRPDPIQPRRVLPEKIHHDFHESRLTPSQALREMVQIAQVAARQRGRPFANLFELLPDPERDETDTKLTSEEELLRELVNLAVTIRDDGQVNPITVVDVSQGATRLYRIETGERRYWSAWLLRDFLPGYESDGMIDCIVVPADRSSVFRQAKENTARKSLSAIAMARQAALLLLTVNGYEIPNYAVTNDFYRQALELRIPRGAGEAIYSAMGGIGRMRFSQFKSLLDLSDEAINIADRHSIDEGILRYVLALPPEDQAEMLQQVVRLNLTVKQVQQICEQGFAENTDTDKVPSTTVKLIRSVFKELDKQTPMDFARAAYEERGDLHMARAYLKRLEQFAREALEHLPEGDR
jgi:ParB-like chromosome segregation protein Spo0J